MLKRIVLFGLLACAGVQSALASGRADDIERTQKAARVFNEIMQTQDQGIPHSLLASAKCVAIIPGSLKFAFIFGGNYGRGVASCRTSRGGWSAPLFVAVEGGSVGYQIGGSSTDLVLLFMTQRSLESLLSDRFKLGAEASVAAGPIGRNAAAATDAKMNTEILSYSRSKGLFAGVSLEGAAFAADKSGDSALYGSEVTRNQIVSGAVPPAPSAAELLSLLRKYSQ